MSPADRLTWSRLLVGPLVFLTIVGGASWPGPWETHFLWALALLLTIFGDLTDLADGALARRAGGGTELGKLADPFTDSVFRLCVYLGLTAIGAFPAWCFLLLLLRDSSNGFLRQIAALRGTALAARWSGKAKAWIQAIGAYHFLVQLLVPVLPSWYLRGGAAFIALFTFGSGLDYLWANRAVFAARKAT